MEQPLNAIQALGINTVTLTPETLLYVARVQLSDTQVVVQPIAETITAAVSFGRPVDAEEDEPAEETYEWQDIFSGDWRIVTTR